MKLTSTFGTHTGNHGSTYTTGAGGGGGGGYSQATVSKFQYMPGGHGGGGGGGGCARPTAGAASSNSGRIANTTEDTALRCSQGFIGNLLSLAFCVEAYDSSAVRMARFSADGGGHGHGGVQDFTPDPGITDLLLLAERAGYTGLPRERDGRVGPVRWLGRVALDSAAGADHGNADAMVVAALGSI